MEYRRVGRAGIKISQFSFGSWVTFASQLDQREVQKTLSYAFDQGINFFDNAEGYALGKSEELMGEAFQKLGLPRIKYLVSTKFFWGLADGPNERNTLNRKYLLSAMEGSLKRLQMDYVDIVYCHRADPNTPLEETCWALHNIIEKGQALYWGTSEWSAREIEEAWKICDRHSLHKPIVEQPQYNLLHREKVEQEFAPLYESIGLGLTTWSPLASGLLTGKYLDGIPKGSRGENRNLSWLQDDINSEKRKGQVRKFVELAKSHATTPALLAIAWCANNPRVSSVILGASSLEQLIENLKVIEVKAKLPASVYREAEAIFG